MGENLEFKRDKEKFTVRIPSGRKRDSTYYNVFGKDPKIIAQILLDIELVDNFPIYEAVKIYLARRNSKDWLGL